MSMSRARFARGHALLAALMVLLLVAPAAYAAQKVTVDAKVVGTPGIGKLVRADVSIKIEDGSALRSVTWRQVSGAPARLIKLASNSVRVRLAAEPAFRKQLIHVLSEAPVPLEPPNVPVAREEFFGGLQDRWQVVGLNPFSLEEAGLVMLEVTVKTTSGTYTDTVGIEVHLPFSVTSGLNNVPVGVPVLLHGKAQAGYAWSLDGPPGSSATLKAANTRNPFFKPDVAGVYELTVNDLATGKPVNLTVYAGMWRGVVVGQIEDADGTYHPVSDTACTVCHGPTSGIAEDMFTPWSESGHAVILSDNLKTSDHYSTSCVSCHSVGFDLTASAKNGGFDDASDFAGFVASDLMHDTGPDNWTRMLEEFPESAKKANIQCENCHGPQVIAGDTSPAHGLNQDLVGEPRVSLSSDVCATCHGEPMRHSRYQQWQLSGHANYETAIAESGRGRCNRCHTSQGFLAWEANDFAKDPADIPAALADTVHPITCVTCHDPHSVGTTTGAETNAPMRVKGDTPMLPSGFKVLSAGNGAICMTCHNTRNGLKNDANSAAVTVTSRGGAPHVPSQTDVLTGYNAYFVRTGIRGGHSYVQDTCVTCHMNKSDAPASISMVGNGTNHTFYAQTDSGICNRCHTGLDIDALQDGFESMLHELEKGIAAKFTAVLKEQIVDKKNSVSFGTIVVSDFAAISNVGFTELHGQQAMDVTINGTRIGVLEDGEMAWGVQMRDVKVIPAGGGAPVLFYDNSISGPDLWKAAYNYLLLHGDGSMGVHNPRWVLEVLDESMKRIGWTNTAARSLRQTDLIVTPR